MLKEGGWAIRGTIGSCPQGKKYAKLYVYVQKKN
jgi:hypothetical protein